MTHHSHSEPYIHVHCHYYNYGYCFHIEQYLKGRGRGGCCEFWNRDNGHTYNWAYKLFTGLFQNNVHFLYLNLLTSKRVNAKLCVLGRGNRTFLYLAADNKMHSGHCKDIKNMKVWGY